MISGDPDYVVRVTAGVVAGGDNNAIASFGLRAVQSGVGLGHHVGDGACHPGARGDTHAHRRIDPLSVHEQGHFLERVANAVRDGHCRLTVDTKREGDEFFAAEPGAEIGGS